MLFLPGCPPSDADANSAIPAAPSPDTCAASLSSPSKHLAVCTFGGLSIWMPRAVHTNWSFVRRHYARIHMRACACAKDCQAVCLIGDIWDGTGFSYGEQIQRETDGHEATRRAANGREANRRRFRDWYQRVRQPSPPRTARQPSLEDQRIRHHPCRGIQTFLVYRPLRLSHTHTIISLLTMCKCKTQY